MRWRVCRCIPIIRSVFIHPVPAPAPKGLKMGERGGREGYRILITIKPTKIKPAIRPTKTQRMSRSIRIIGPIIHKINIIHPEIHIPEPRPLGNGMTLRPGPGETSVEGWGHDQHAEIDVVDFLAGGVLVCCGMGYCYGVFGGVFVGLWGGLAEEGYGSVAGYV